MEITDVTNSVLEFHYRIKYRKIELGEEGSYCLAIGKKLKEKNINKLIKSKWIFA